MCFYTYMMHAVHTSQPVDKITSDCELLSYVLYHNYYNGMRKSHAVNIDGTATTVEDFKEVNVNICNKQLILCC